MSIKVERYCCTCGVYKEGKTSGDNPTTMCENCVDEKANHCIRCRADLSMLGQTICLCNPCQNIVFDKK